MAIAPIEDRTDDAPRRGLRVLDGGRPASAPPRGAALHARDDRAEALRRSRDAHPATTTRPDRPSPSSRRPGVASPDASWAADEVPRSAAAQRGALAGEGGRGASAVRPEPAIRAQTVARRRRTMGAGVVLLAVVLLAMPLRALGAVTVSGQPTPAGVPAGLAPGSIYVVQPGDTLASIAARVNAAALTSIEHQLVVSTGSPTVVPGEHVTIP